ncbi:hypothetical protein F5888DRAFT_1639258 [Russula emetica]|nr:hypothetical protein F5888DRAFT_1639258 [Russula emetica]
MTIFPSPSRYNGSITVQFSNIAEYKLYPWFGETFTAHAKLNYPLFGISPPMRQLFPGYSSDNDKSSNVFAVTLEFSGPDNGAPKEMCLKLARGEDEVVHLSREASFYRNELAKLSGIAVPRICLAMQTVRKVHTLGVTQNLSLELHHFVMKDNNVLLIDFSRAVEHHQCNAVPICSNQRICPDEEDGLEVVDHDCKDMRAVSVAPSIEDCAILMP